MGRSKGGGKSKGASTKGKKSPAQTRSNNKDAAMAAVSNPISEQSASRDRSRSRSSTPKKSNKAKAMSNVVTFEEEGHLVEMETEGMDTDFLTDAGEISDDEDVEVRSINNNATAMGLIACQRREETVTTPVDYDDRSEEESPPDSCPDMETESDCEVEQLKTKKKTTKTNKKRKNEDEDISSLRAELDQVNRSFAKLQKLMESGNYNFSTEKDQPSTSRGKITTVGRKVKENKRVKNRVCQDDDSEVTIYRDAVKQKRDSSSSDEIINTSDETVDESLAVGDKDNNQFYVDRFINSFQTDNPNNFVTDPPRARVIDEAEQQMRMSEPPRQVRRPPDWEAEQ